MTYKYIRYFSSLILAFCQLAIGQPKFGPEGPGRENFPVSFEAIPIFEHDTSHALVHIHYRIPENFFVFVRNAGMSPDVFVAKGELLVELIDEKGISAARHIKTILRSRRTIPPLEDPPNEIQGFIRLVVPEGTYRIHFGLDDVESDRSFLNKEHKVSTRTPSSVPLDVSFPMFVQRGAEISESPTQYIVHNYGTDVLFGIPVGAGYLFQINLFDSDGPLSVKWKLTNERQSAGLEPLVLTGESYQIQRGFLQVSEVGENIQYSIAPTSTSWHAVFVPLPLEKVEQGQCKLEITFTQKDLKKNLTYNFYVHWPGKPLSLRSPDLAIDALQVIASEQELEKMKSLSFQRRTRAFYEFWRHRDRDTTTAFNELMVEYYRRVDHALREYSVSRQTDGYKTDRGKIYILYGTPTKVERFLRPGAVPTEVWTYQGSKKRFIFSDPRRAGIYSLISVDDL